MQEGHSLMATFEGYSLYPNTDGLWIIKVWRRFQRFLSQLEIHGAGVLLRYKSEILRSLPLLGYSFLIMRNNPGLLHHLFQLAKCSIWTRYIKKKDTKNKPKTDPKRTRNGKQE
ncbi:hypothetical protein Tco_0856765 [Tanacetum coccineum]|uniref:Uncharacterized protein n=1 Tax=Tanacetum coccineum TaxID=301880 RepID=A0ABQ5B850_9ASTR